MPTSRRALALAALLSLPALAAEPTKAPSPPAAPTADAHREHLKAAQVMVGEWAGEGWMDRGPRGGRHTFHVKESVQPRLDGTVLLVEGRGTSAPTPGAPEVPTHQALGVLSWDPKAGHLRFSAYRLGSGVVDTEMKSLGEGAFEWGFDVPGGRVRYSIRIRDGVWTEKGELTRDGGKTYAQFLEMTVRRQG